MVAQAMGARVNFASKRPPLQILSATDGGLNSEYYFAIMLFKKILQNLHGQAYGRWNEIWKPLKIRKWSVELQRIFAVTEQFSSRFQSGASALPKALRHLQPNQTMWLKNLLSTALIILPCLLLANGPVEDNSKAGQDGPFVLYRGRQIVVKAVECRDSVLVPTATKYRKRSDLNLHCFMPTSPDFFTFRLREALTVEPEIYPLPAKMLVLSDIEGDFQALKLMLTGAGVMDSQFQWTYGSGHLVLLGDFFDRGLQVTECLWLIYKLESEAMAAGGKLHFILGNHEVLNLEGTTQYVRRKYLENAALIQEDYKRWYAEDTELGRWLRTKNAVERIGSNVFCHGGISPELAQSAWSLKEVNDIARQYLGVPYEKITDPAAQLVFDVKVGIFWYRDAAKNLLTEEEVTLILDYAGAKRMVVGHTLQNDITGLYAGRVICVDLYHEENIRQNYMKTLLIENGRCYVLDSRGGKTTIFSLAFSKKQD